MTPQNVLVIKLRYLGDVLLATPTLKALKSSYPSLRVTMVVNRGTEGMLVGNPHVDEVLPLERGSLLGQWRFLSGLRQRRFDIVIDLTDADRSAFLTRMSLAPMRIGFNAEQRMRGWCYTDVVRADPASHRIDRDLAALKPLNIVAGDKTPRLWLTPQDDRSAEDMLARLGVTRDRPIVVLQPGARYWFKAWPVERFAELGDRLQEKHGCHVLIGGSNLEAELAQQIVQLSKSRPTVLAGQVSIRTFAAVLKLSDLFIGNDSGVMHIAAAVGTPVVALFGPSNPAEWGPRGALAEILYKGLDCRACFHPTCHRGEQNCMRLITLDEVVSAAVRLLKHSRAAAE